MDDLGVAVIDAVDAWPASSGVGEVFPPNVMVPSTTDDVLDDRGVAVVDIRADDRLSASPPPVGCLGDGGAELSDCRWPRCVGVLLVRRIEPSLGLSHKHGVGGQVMGSEALRGADAGGGAAEAASRPLYVGMQHGYEMMATPFWAQVVTSCWWGAGRCTCSCSGAGGDGDGAGGVSVLPL